MKRHRPFSTEKSNYTLWGILFGTVFPVVATVTHTLELHGTLSFSTMFDVQCRTHLLWIIDLAPIVLASVFRRHGKIIDTLNGINAELEQDVITVAEHLGNKMEIVEELKGEVVRSRKRESKLISEKVDQLLANEDTPIDIIE